MMPGEIGQDQPARIADQPHRPEHREVGDQDGDRRQHPGQQQAEQEAGLGWELEAPESVAGECRDCGADNGDRQRHDQTIEETLAEQLRLPAEDRLLLGMAEDALVVLESGFVDRLDNAFGKLRIGHERRPEHPEEGHHRPQQDEQN